MANAPETLRVLIADDSAICRQALREALEADPEVKVVAEAQDGLEAVSLTLRHRPHLVTMDLRMPKLNGLEAIEQIMRQRPTPILVVTDQPRLDGVDATFAALSRGALDLLPKATAWHVTGEAKALVAKVKQLTRAASEPRSSPGPTENRGVPKLSTDVAVIGIGASTGGPRALKDILSALPASFELPVAVVQHMNVQFHDGFVQWLARQVPLPVKPAVDGARLQKGTVIVAPQGADLVIETGGLVRLKAPAPGAVYAPAVDRLFASLAESFGNASAGILLTGMGQDGAKGLKAIADRGGATVAQDRRTSVIHGMPGAAIALGAVQWVFSPPQISAFMLDCAGAQPAHSPAMSSGTQRKKVLLVDDSAVVLEATRHALEDGGYDVITSDNPIALPALVRKEKPDLALVDVKMPAVAGDAVARIIGQGQGATSVILYSDLGKSELATLAQECGAKGYLKKSSPEQLLAYVNHFFAKGGRRP